MAVQVARLPQGYLLICLLLSDLLKNRGEGKPPGLLKPFSTPSHPLAVLTMDFVTYLPLCKGGNTILVVVDAFSKQAHFVLCVELPSAKTLAKLFLHHVVKLHHFLERMISNHGTQFVASFWLEFLTLAGIERVLSSSHYPQTDGQTERVNQMLEGFLRCYINFQQDNWVELLPFAEYPYNNSKHASTGDTSFHIAQTIN